MKTCFKCAIAKPLVEFYRHAEMADGYLNKCKECTKADVRRYWEENGDVLRQTDRVRRKISKQAAVTAGNALRDGRLPRADTCYYCGASERLQKHHWNYYRPLDVWWLCKRCHRIADMARRDAETRVALYREEAS
jgi:hypothetical protein